MRLSEAFSNTPTAAVKVLKDDDITISGLVVNGER
jgi:hypothetical protein